MLYIISNKLGSILEHIAIPINLIGSNWFKKRLLSEWSTLGYSECMPKISKVFEQGPGGLTDEEKH